MIYTTIDNFYVTEEQLANSPSRADGISQEVETQLRIYGCELIQEGGILLRLPQAVMATGQVLLHRFYVKESMLKFNIKRVAWACCWLATKLEETPRRIRDLLSVFVRIDKRREGKPLAPLDIYSKEYETRKQELINVERHLLRTFGFILHVDHPHKFVLNYLNILEAGAALKQEAWNLSNDSLRTTLCVRFKGETVACGIIFLAARRLKVPLPEDPPWWELFKVKRADMFAVAREVHALYQLPKMTYVSVYRAQQGSPRDAPAAKEGTPMVSPATMVGTPAQSGPDSEQGGTSLRRGNKDGPEGPGSGGSVDRNSNRDTPPPEGAAADAGRRWPEGEPRKHKRSRSEREREDAEDGERSKRHYRRKDTDEAPPDYRYKEERSSSRREREPGRKKDRKDREGRERDRERSGRDREVGRERDKDRERERKRVKDPDRGEAVAWQRQKPL